MRSKARLSKLSKRDEDTLSKLSKKEKSVAVSGEFDEKDIKDLTILFDTYDKYTNGDLKKFVRKIMLERTINNRKNNIKSVYEAETLTMRMPKDLQEEVEKYWPSIWTNQKHMRDFLNAFPMFRLS